MDPRAHTTQRTGTARMLLRLEADRNVLLRPLVPFIHYIGPVLHDGAPDAPRPSLVMPGVIMGESQRTDSAHWVALVPDGSLRFCRREGLGAVIVRDLHTNEVAPKPRSPSPLTGFPRFFFHRFACAAGWGAAGSTTSPGRPSSRNRP